MQDSDIAALSLTVLWAAFSVSVFFGWVLQRTQFCTMGAISDVVNMGDKSRATTWLLAALTGSVGLWALAALGWLDVGHSIYASGRIIVLSALIGGASFGFGMVLASGCGSKTLVRIGGGSLKSLVVFAVMGLSAYAALRGITASFRVSYLDPVALHFDSALLPQMLATALGITASQVGLTLAIALFAIAWLWALRSAEFRASSGPWSAVGIGLCVTLMWYVSGHLGYVAEHPQTLEEAFLATNTNRMEGLTFTAPMAYTLHWLMLYSDASNHLTLAIVSVVGVVVGSAIENWRSGSFRWEGFAGTQDTALHLFGALLMGFGGVTAMGCTVGQGLSGIGTLSLNSLIAVIGIIAGAVGGLKFQLWLLMRDD